MWRMIAAADITLGEPPAEVVARLRKATDVRQVPPSHRWSPRGLFLASVAAEGDKFDILYLVLRSRFRAQGVVKPAESMASMVRVELTEDPWGNLVSAVCVLAGISLLGLAWHANEARFLGGWLVFMAAVGFAHQYTARSRARSMIQALSAFWGVESEPSGVARRKGGGVEQGDEADER